MEALISRKATDSELGLARKNLQDTISYWGVNWNARTLDELPDYVKDQYVLYTHVLWLEEQLAALREEKKDDTVQTHDRPSSEADKSDSTGTQRVDDKAPTDDGLVLHPPVVHPNKPISADRTGGVEVRPTDGNLPRG